MPDTAVYVAGGLIIGAHLGGLLIWWLLRPDLTRANGDRQTSQAALAGTSALAIADQALRGLASACADVGHAQPQAHTMILDQQAVRLALAPADTDPPAPWRSVQDGWRWELDRDAAAAVATAPSSLRSPGDQPYPLLTLVGAAHGALVAVNFAQASGAIALNGDEAYRRALAATLARRLAVQPAGVVRRVVVAGFGTLLGAPAGATAEWQELRTAEEALSLLPGHPPWLASSSEAGVFSGPVAAAPGEVVVLGEAPAHPETAAAVAHLAMRPDRLVVVAGDLPGARWRWHVSADGAVELDPLGVTVDVPALDPTARELCRRTGRAPLASGHDRRSRGRRAAARGARPA